jgi:chemotaxis response regulator CheB
MPGEAVRIGAAERVLPLEEIAPAILAAVGNARGAQ